ncbi:DUF6318 family protein [Georgenia phoenicis]|uniref:DUF6318 family protein n=1 Tax=unclassified Georgenia TaxID=2626815 RepID=UPI0039B089DB
MTRSTRGRRVGAALVTLGFVLVGCSDADGDAAPTTSPSPEDTPTTAEPTTPAPGPTPWPEPTRPAEMDRDDIEGAKAAAQYFLELFPYVYATGDLSDWESMSGPDCRFCASVVEDVTALAAQDGYGLGGEVQISDVRAAPPDEEFAHFRVGVKAIEAPSWSYSSSGELLDSTDGGEVLYTVAVMREEDWIIRAIALEEP